MRKRLQSDALFETGAFSVDESGLRIHGTPGPSDWAAAGRAIARLRGGTSWAVGDWLLYAEEQDFPADVVESAMEATGLKRGSLFNLKSVSKAFPVATRSVEMGWSHHALVAGFDAEVRGELLRRAGEQKLSWEALRAHCATLRHAVKAQMQQWPEGTFGVILADVPWKPEVGAEAVVPTEEPFPAMSSDELSALAPNVQRIAAPNCVLYLWTPNTRLEDALAVIRAWGFTYRTNHAWVRQNSFGGVWNRQRHELLLVAARGVPVPPTDEDLPDSVINDRGGMHADRPLDSYVMIEKSFESAPKVELFARRPRFGWSAWGAEVLAATQTPKATRAVRLREHVGAPA